MSYDEEKLTNVVTAADNRYVKKADSENFTTAEKTKLAGLDSTNITVEEQATAESGYAKTYVVKQDDSQVGVKINIPKDFLVKSASMESCATANSPVNGLAVGDKYIDFVVNTKDNDETASHIYLPVNDLVDVYTADNTTLELSNGVFSVKDGGITLTKLAQSVQTSLGYADAYHDSPASGITSANITSWNNKSDLTISDVQTEVASEMNDMLTALATKLNS